MNSYLCCYCNQQIFTYYNPEKNRSEPISKYWKEKSNKIEEMYCSPRVV